jgi:hypothetical protein
MVTPSQLWQEKYLPLYIADLVAEGQRRAEAFGDFTFNILGVECRQISADDLFMLEGIGSPFAFQAAAEALECDVVNFLWLLSPANRPGPLNRLRFHMHRERIRAQLRAPAALDAARLACGRHVERALADCPPPRAEGDGGRPSSTHFLAALLLRGARATGGWPEADLRSMPLARLVQYLRADDRRELGEKFHDLTAADRHKSDWLGEVNALRARGELVDDQLTTGMPPPSGSENILNQQSAV